METDPRGQGRHNTDFPTDIPQVHDFDLVGLGGSVGKKSACNAGDLSSNPGSGRCPGEGMATHSGILAWRIPWLEEPGRLLSMGSQSVYDLAAEEHHRLLKK